MKSSRDSMRTTRGVSQGHGKRKMKMEDLEVCMDGVEGAMGYTTSA